LVGICFSVERRREKTGNGGVESGTTPDGAAGFNGVAVSVFNTVYNQSFFDGREVSLLLSVIGGVDGTVQLDDDETGKNADNGHGDEEFD